MRGRKSRPLTPNPSPPKRGRGEKIQRRPYISLSWFSYWPTPPLKPNVLPPKAPAPKPPRGLLKPRGLRPLVLKFVDPLLLMLYELLVLTLNGDVLTPVNVLKPMVLVGERVVPEMVLGKPVVLLDKEKGLAC